jgi:predicted acylesterase/phospholipase RssA
MKNKEAAEPSQDRADRRPLPRIGVALGSGSARGWSHIGVLRVLEGAGISPHIVCGTSIGALVGAAYAAGELERLEAWVRSLTRQVVVGLLDLKLGAGLIEGAKLLEFPPSRRRPFSSCSARPLFGPPGRSAPSWPRAR